MKAIVYHKYGSPDELKLTEVEKPAPKDNEVLIRVSASSINSWDWDRLTGRPKIYQLLSGVGKPNIPIPGADVAGTVEAVGKAVTRFKPGDEVFGDLCEKEWSCFAEYVCARESALTLKPSSMSFEQAAATPQAGLLAWQGLNDKRKLRAGDQVLINGAGGGVGTFAIQMAKMVGAEVTGVDLSEKHEVMLAAGADQVIDYRGGDFTAEKGRSYDLILDVMAHHSLSAYNKILKPGGIYSMVGGLPKRILQLMLFGGLMSARHTKKMAIMAHRPNQGLGELITQFEAGHVKPVIDKVYPLAEAAEAFRYFGTGLVKGKLVIKLT